MKKFLYIATIIATVATATTSCKNEVDDLFDKSAADRTQEAQDEYTNALTANGGKWVLEYFTNSEEEKKKEILSISHCRDEKGKFFWLIHRSDKVMVPVKSPVDIDDLNNELDNILIE